MAMGADSVGFMGLGSGFKFFPVFSDYYGFSSGFFLVFSGFFPVFFWFFSGYFLRLIYCFLFTVNEVNKLLCIMISFECFILSNV